MPTERILLQALAMARWVAFLWLSGVVLFSSDAQERPLLAGVVVGAALVACTITTAALRRRPAILLHPAYVAADLALAVGLYAADGGVYEPGHVFATSQNLAGQWPLIAVLHASVALVPWQAGLAGGIVGCTRYLGAIANRFTGYTPKHHVSVASSVVFLAVAGTVGALLARVLRKVETEVLMRRARDDVARTLHDTVLQTLAVVEQRAAASDPELAAIARRSDRELRAYLFGAAAQNSPDTIEAAVRTAVERVQQLYDVNVIVNVVDDGEPPDRRRLHALAGAIGEAVANAAEHAQASRVVVYVESDEDGHVFASINDDGIGFEPAQVGDDQRGISSSIVGRMVDAGGRAEITSAVGRGTEVRLWTR